MSLQARGFVTIDEDECKGCGLCVDACPPGCLHLAPALSAYGVHPATYDGEGCTGCGICFYCCPEPGAITVYLYAVAPKREQATKGDPPAKVNLEEEAAVHA